MKSLCCAAVLTSVSMLFVGTISIANDPTKETKWTFSDAKIGTLPPGWIAGVTGSQRGKPPKWEVIRGEEHHVLAQLEPGGKSGDFPVCLKKGSSMKNGRVTIRFKPISGRIDQAGGVVFRAKDKDNFYIARANALEDNVSLYVTHKGKRKTIKYWEDIEVTLGEWHELTVDVHGFSIKVSLDGKPVGEITDENQIFGDAGMVGFWTKADSVTHFDTLSISPSK